MSDNLPVRDDSKCQDCQMRPANDLHTCPYAEEISDDHETECDCCPECEAECARDI